MSSSIADSSLSWLSVHHGCPPSRAAARDVVEVDETRRAERLDVDRRVAADRGRRPRRLQELPAGLDQVGRAGADLLRIADQHRGARGQVVGQQRQLGRAAAAAAAPPCRRPGCPRTAWPACRARCPATLLSCAGCSAASLAARSRTSSVSSSSRHGTAITASTAISGMDRWSATENIRISETSSPQNSTRTGCSAVGGKTSRMPPRTANSPRLPTMSTRV